MNITQDDILTFFSITSAPIGVIIGWKKDLIKVKLGIVKEKKVVESQTILNLESIIEALQKTIESLQKNLDLYQEMVDDLSIKYLSEIKELKGVIQSLKAYILELEEVIQSLENTIKQYKSKFGDLN